MIILVGAGAALFAYQQGWFSGFQPGGEGGDEVYGQAEFEATGMSTLCKCGSGRATHVGGDCNSCKASCQERCGGCTPQCISSGANKPTKAKSGSGNPRSTITSTLCKCGSARATHVQGMCSACKTSCRGRCGNCTAQCLSTTNPTVRGAPPTAKPLLANARAAPKKPLRSVLCKCGSARATHVIGDCVRCRQSCRSRCGNCTPRCGSVAAANVGEEDYFPQELIPAMLGREDAYEEPLYFSNVGYVGNIRKTTGVPISAPAISQWSGPW